MKKCLFSVGLIMVGVTVFGQAKETDSIRMVELQSVEVISTRASEKTPVAHTTISREELSKMNNGVDMPSLLTSSPSVVITSDAGAGIGYTGIRIRGSDASRINVTVNGVPMNDGESHTVFWVNTPDLAASIEDIQIQRGVGTSTNGAGSFGASINLKTEPITPQPYAEISGSYGSYGTHRQSIGVGTGLLGGRWAFNARLSNIGSEGYIDRAATKLKSYFFQAGYYGKNTVLKFITFAGKEETYHAWNGISRLMLKTDRRYNSCGEIEQVLRNPDGSLLLDGNANIQTKVSGFYKDQTDNYALRNYQMLFTQRLNERLNLNVTLHYYKGDGYYEEYKNAEEFVNYGLMPFFPTDPSKEAYLDGQGRVNRSNLVRRKQMDNWFGGGVFSLNYSSSLLKASLGGALNRYDGNHFGQVRWVQNYAGDYNLSPTYEYYRNKGTKTDGNIYLKANWQVVKGLYLFGDVQYRHINYGIKGLNDKWDESISALQQLVVDRTFDFFNPKAGVMYDLNESWNVYASVAVAKKEPSRNNFTDAMADKKPSSERLLDYEVGVGYRGQFFSAGANFYYMKYKDQLIMTGMMNHIGEPLSENFPDSYRMGIELTAGARLSSWLRWDVNTTLSRNKIKNYRETIEGSQWSPGDTDIAFSPSVIAGSLLSADYRKWSLSLQSAYVGRQYMTNSASALNSHEKSDDTGAEEDLTLDGYFVNNLRLGYTFKLPYMRSVNIGVMINNIFNEKYCSNGGGGSYFVKDNTAPNGKYHRYNYSWFFPQATTNVLASITLKF